MASFFLQSEKCVSLQLLLTDGDGLTKRQNQTMKKTLAIASVILAIILTILAGAYLMMSRIGSKYDGRIVIHPTTETVTDSIVIDSNALVECVRLSFAGELSDTLFLTISDGSSQPWEHAMIGHIDEKWPAYDWYYHKLFVKYRAKSASEQDSLVMTCWFGR